MSQPNLFSFFFFKKKGSPQGETPVKLGNCAELVGVAELVESVAPVTVAFSDDVISLPLAVDDVVDVDVEGVSCDHTTTIVDAKSWRMKNSKRMGRCKKFIVLV